MSKSAAGGGRSSALAAELPQQVRELFDREREVATIVYTMRRASASAVQARLSKRLSNGAVRSMLNRLVVKGILKRVRRGRHGAFVYLPALNTAVVTQTALRQLADDFFSGSLHRAALAIIDLAKEDRSSGDGGRQPQSREAA